MPVAAPAIGVLAAFAAMFFLVCLYYAYGYSLGAFLQGLANFFRSIGFSLGWFGRISLAFVGDGIDKVDSAIRDGLGWGIIHTRATALYLWHYTAHAITAIGDAIANLAEATEHALAHAVAVTIPAFLTSRLAWVVAHITALEKQVAHLPARVERITVERVHTVSRVIVHEAAAVAGAIPNLRIGSLQREAASLDKWVKSHAKLFTVSGIAGLIGATIFREFNLGWLRCRGVSKVGRALCGASGLIESIFSDVIDALIVTDLCEFVNALDWAATKFEPVLTAFVDLEDALIGCRGITAAGDLPVPRLSLPAVTAGLTL